MTYQGVLRKMQTEHRVPIDYYLVFDHDFLNMNQVLNKSISLNFLHFWCTACNSQKKIFANGVCYQCFMQLPEMGEWVIRPELSRAHLDEEHRNLEFEKRVQLQPHIVYLANSSNVKVGVTRKEEVPTRWIAQDADQ